MKRRKFESRVLLFWKKYGWIFILAFKCGFWQSFLIISAVIFGPMFSFVFNTTELIGQILAVILVLLVFFALEF